MNRKEYKELQDRRLEEILEAAIPATESFRLSWEEDKERHSEYQAYSGGYVFRIAYGTTYRVEIRTLYPVNGGNLISTYVHENKTGGEHPKLFILCQRLMQAIQQQPDQFNRNCDSILESLRGYEDEDVADESSG